MNPLCCVRAVRPPPGEKWYAGFKACIKAGG